MLSNALSKLRILKKAPHSKQVGFTLIELMVGVSILAIMLMIALPNLSDFTTRMRVDNEISELNRLLLVARNTAINEGVTVTLCPLSANVCSNNWKDELTVFIDNPTSPTNPQTPKFDANDRIIKVKASINVNDKLQYDQNFITYDATGHTTSVDSKGNYIESGGPYLFKYCPKESATLSRGIYVSLSGRVKVSSDTNNDGQDDIISTDSSSTRAVITCS